MIEFADAVFWWTGAVSWAGFGIAGLLVSAWSLIECIVRQLGLFSSLFDAIYNREKYRSARDKAQKTGA